MKRNTLILAGLTALALPAVASADPVTASLATILTFNTGMTLATAYAISSVAVTIGTTFLLGRVSQALFGKPSGSRTPTGQTLMIRSSNASRDIVYGQVKKSGAALFAGL